MLHAETVEAGTLDLIRRFMLDQAFKEFRLVGGTALSLYLGHRISIDIDLFCNTDFNSPMLAAHVNEVYNGEKTKTIKNGVFSLVDNIKVDLIAHQYSWLTPINEVEQIRMASLDDIGAMKIHAIVQSGNRLKDFVDIHYLLEQRSMSQLINAYELKYPEANRTLALNAVTYFADIDFDVPVKLIGQPLLWDKIATRIRAAANDPQLTFQTSAQKVPRKRRGRGI